MQMEVQGIYSVMVCLFQTLMVATLTSEHTTILLCPLRMSFGFSSEEI